MLTTEEEAFLDALYQRFARIVFMYSYSLLLPLPDAWSMAEEGTQDTFEKSMAKIDILRRHESPEGWLMTTCRNVTLTRRRKESLCNHPNEVRSDVATDEMIKVLIQNGVIRWYKDAPLHENPCRHCVCRVFSFLWAKRR